MRARGTWKTVFTQIDRLYTEGTSLGWSDGQLLSRFTAACEESQAAFSIGSVKTTVAALAGS